MSKTHQQPVGQKRLKNVAVPRSKKPHEVRFDIACYQNKVISGRSGVDKDLDEVLQSQIVYSEVFKRLRTGDRSTICLEEILNNEQLQVHQKERKSQLSSHRLREVATIVAQKTLNPRIDLPYSIKMIELMLIYINYLVDPNSSSFYLFDLNSSAMQQALQVIPALQKRWPLKCSLMRLRFTVAPQHFPSLVEKVVMWNANIVSKDELGSQPSMICDIEPGFYWECDPFIKELEGKLEVFALPLRIEEDTKLEDLHEDSISSLPMKTTNQLSAKIQRQNISKTENKVVIKKNDCSACKAFVGEGKENREHFKSDWHKQNLKRKMKKLPPLTLEECLAHVDIGDSNADLKEYSI